MKPRELKIILEGHVKWSRGEPGHVPELHQPRCLVIDTIRVVTSVWDGEVSVACLEAIAQPELVCPNELEDVVVMKRFVGFEKAIADIFMPEDE